jgi:hypothetical protein
MRKVAVLFSLALGFVAVGCGDAAVVADMPIADLSMPDLVPPRDLSMPDFSGVSCGSMTCGASQSCCIMGDGAGGFTAMCMPTGTCDTDAGGTLVCDGPEDCPAAMNECCIGVNGSGMMDADAGTTPTGSGGSQCVHPCVAVINVDDSFNFDAHSRLCHTNADCQGLSGDINTTQFGNFKNQPFDRCCTAQQTQGFSVCLPSQATQFGATCQ